MALAKYLTAILSENVVEIVILQPKATNKCLVFVISKVFNDILNVHLFQLVGGSRKKRRIASGKETNKSFAESNFNESDDDYDDDHSSMTSDSPMFQSIQASTSTNTAQTLPTNDDYQFQVRETSFHLR